MKKLILLLLFTTLSFGQEFGVTKLNVIGKKNELKEYQKINNWIDYDSIYLKSFDTTPVGIKRAFSELKQILLENKIDFNKPFLNSSLLASYVKGFDDYENLNLSIKVGDSEVILTWLLGDKDIIINLTKEVYFITISKS